MSPVDGQFDGADLIAVCRTSWDGADHHDSNSITFHPTRNLRTLTPAALAAGDFGFRAGNGDDPAGWAVAPTPRSITVRPGGGVDGSDRVTLIWADNDLDGQVDPNEAVANNWLSKGVSGRASRRASAAAPCRSALEAPNQPIVEVTSPVDQASYVGHTALRPPDARVVKWAEDFVRNVFGGPGGR